ncbi:MAG TPA: hypothetical protein PK331_08260 [Gordonia sp. (in: high G+C Gram-positive bacteria)]|uniref:FitA-like ribbon-helix-helix domain-containing protein n=1 Tax=unclassified Gordonia (in: high G+C Gram-positive bacteria) TaxID=2657482 RepID=UPI000FC0A5B7|nr:MULTISPECIES: hypothetical protein [unclassified Gordonia (in: high G+C Gram-positive bacteria)]RUP39807.1 MAG: hypothetical protein EKK60_05875 [Gordonia sp. (in: high G+C Gram-positive bacteria)]HNP57350.1 hypothetical protein [Gordonia sp. (in: high G+C Gram-positive bacteria)]HRC50896.1 hypothetical protein [Gordonia sp. (in: high G+C Gram-positive bacteria)]
MSKVIQVRDLSDETHEKLVQAAAARGLSLTRYIRAELEAIARREAAAQHNAEVIRKTQAGIGYPDIADAAIRAATDEGRP